MGFTLKALLPPAICFLAVAYFTRNDVRNTTAGPLGLLVVIWGMVAFFVVVVYWAARIWKRATRDTPDDYRHR
jgi:hypothetical protein